MTDNESSNNPYDEAAARVLQSQAAQVRNNIFNSVPQNPAVVAQHDRIANELNVPIESVESDPELAKQQAAMKALDAHKVVTQYPHLAQFLQIPVNAAKAHTDMQTLAALEQGLKQFPNSPSMTAWEDAPTPAIRDRIVNAWAGLTGGQDASALRQGAQAAEANAILAARQSHPELRPTKEDTPEQVAAKNDQAWEMSRQAVGGMSQIPQALAENAIQAGTFGLVRPVNQVNPHSTEASIAGGAGQLAGFIAGPAKLGTALFGSIPGTGALAASVGDGYIAAIAKEAAAQAGALGTASALQATGSAALDSQSGVDAARKVIQAAGSGALTGSIFGVASKALPGASILNWGGRALGVTAAQDLISGQRPWDDRSIQQKIFDYGQNAYFTRHPEVLQRARDTDKAEQATKDMQVLQGLGELAAESKLRGHDPDAFKAFLKSVSDSGNLPDVWIDAHTLENALHQSGITPENLQEQLPDVARQMNEAINTRGDVRIETPDYLTHIAGSPLEQSILPHLKTDPEGMTFQQGQDHLTEQQSTFKDDARRLAEQKIAKDARDRELDTIEADTHDQLVEAGQSPDAARHYARLHRAFYDTISERMGITPTDLRNRKPLTIGAVNAGGYGQNKIGRALARKVAEHFNDSVREYGELEGAEGGRVLDVDLARELSPEYRTDRSRASDVHHAASAFINKLYERLLAEPAKPGGEVFFTAGGSGSGKSIARNSARTTSSADIVYDTTMSNLGSANSKIEKALKSGRNVTIAYVYRDPVDAFSAGVIPRAEQTGLTVPISFHAQSHVGARDTIEKLAEKYKDDSRVNFIFIDNSHGSRNHREVSLKDLPGVQYEGLVDRLHSTLEDAKNEGRITDTTFRAIAELQAGQDNDARGSRGFSQADRAGDIGGRHVQGSEQNDSTEESRLSQQARGSYNPANDHIALHKDVDVSTFLHESGHFFLEAMHDLAQSPDAPEGIKADFDKFLRLAKTEGDTPEERLANWTAKEVNDKRAGHEMFAVGFENYLMTGRAPVPELQSLFGRFRAWLVNVYKGLQGSLSPELKGIFDRMLASQEAIEQAERARAYFLPDLPAEHGELVDQYKTEAKEATEDAIAQMQARSLRDMKWLSNAKGKMLKELQKEADTQRQAINEQVTKEVDDMPVYKAQTALEQAKPQTEIERDMIAELHGYQNGDDMLRDIEAKGPREKLIKDLTDKMMLERHGDLVDPVSIERAAEAAIHNEARARMMATGLKMFTKTPISARELAKAAKQEADIAIAGLKVGELRPQQYSAAETRANKEVLKLAPKDPARAADAQRTALINNRLFKSATDAVAEIDRGLQYMKKFNKDSIRNKIDLDIRDQIDDLLSRFDLRKNPTNAPTRPQLNLEKWIESQNAAGYSPSVSADMLRPEFRTEYRDMTVEQFRGLVDSIKSMEHLGRERHSLTIQGEKHDLSEFINTELVPKLQERGQRFSAEQLYTKAEDRGLSAIGLTLDRLFSWLRSVGSQLKPQEFKRNHYDLHDITGPFGYAIFDPVIDANYKKVRMLQGLSDDFRKAAEGLGREWQKSLVDSIDNRILHDDIATKEAGVPVMLRLTRGRMIGLALHTGNESNFDKLTRGYNWAAPDVWRFLQENMTAKDWSAVQSVWDLYEKHWPDMQAMYERLGQTTPDKIEPRSFKAVLKDGSVIDLKGGYAAIKYDPLRSRRGEKDAAGQAINPADGLFNRDYFSRTSTTNGSMNKRIEGYTDAIDLDFHTVERALQESIHDLAYREALINVNKIIENSDFRREFFKAYGREDYRALQDWIGRIANADNADRNVGALGRFLQYTRTGMVMTAIGLRATTVLKHGLSAGVKSVGYFVAGGEKYFAARTALMATDYMNQIETAKEKFGEINARLLQQDRDYRATASSLFEPESFNSKAERFGHSAVAWFDMMTAVPTAWAAYDRAITEGIPKRQGGTGKPMTEKQAVAYANKMVREAHGSNVESARSNVMTAPSEALKMFTTLYGFMNNTYGQIADSASKLNTPGLGKPEVLARTFMAIIVPSFIAHWLTEGGSDDESAAGWAKWAGKAITGEVAGTVPFVRDAWSMVQGFGSAGVVGAESWLSTMINAGKDVYKVSTGQHVNKPIQHTADAVGMGLHIPGMGQIGKTAQYLHDVSTGREHPEGIVDAVSGALLGHKQHKH